MYCSLTKDDLEFILRGGIRREKSRNAARRQRARYFAEKRAKYVAQRVIIECSKSPVNLLDVPARRPGEPPANFEVMVKQVRQNDPNTAKPETRGRKRKKRVEYAPIAA